jgi:hypothetical protein
MSGGWIAIGCLILCLILFARADQETRRAFCIVFIILSIVAIIIVVNNPRVLTGGQ